MRLSVRRLGTGQPGLALDDSAGGGSAGSWAEPRVAVWTGAPM